MKSIEYYKDSTSCMIQHALTEFTFAGWMDKNGIFDSKMQEAICMNMLEILDALGEQGHSGFSMGYMIPILHKLMKLEPLSPLSGTDEEWVEVGPGVLQNKRCGRVFKNEYGPYDIDGRVFRDADGGYYTSKESHVPITFPYTPKTEYVDAPREDTTA